MIKLAPGYSAEVRIIETMPARVEFAAIAPAAPYVAVDGVEPWALPDRLQIYWPLGHMGSARISCGPAWVDLAFKSLETEDAARYEGGLPDITALKFLDWRLMAHARCSRDTRFGQWIALLDAADKAQRSGHKVSEERQAFVSQALTRAAQAAMDLM